MNPFVCTGCGDEHDLDEISLGADAPEQWSLATEAERARSTLTPDQCVLETSEGETHRFVRCCLQIPIHGGGQPFTWGVWASLSAASFDEMHAHWNDAKRAALGPYFGWLSTAVPGYPDTMFLKAQVQQRPVGERPLLVLEPSDHPLAVHQRAGISKVALTTLIAPNLH